jgi:GntR family transcriptional regulator
VISIDKYSQVPIYEQIISEIERLILLGLMKPGSPLPSVRSLSQELSINPNTLQKAYSELERRGVCRSVPGTGRFISDNAVEILRGEYEAALPGLADAVKRLAISGVPFDLICKTIKKSYNEAESKKGETQE